MENSIFVKFPPQYIHYHKGVTYNMFESENVDPVLYSNLMEQIKRVNMDWIELRKSKTYKIGLVFCELTQYIKRLEVRKAIRAIQRWVNGRKIAKVKSIDNCAFPGSFVEDVNPQRYFQKNRIAIYSAVFGDYDNILEPYIVPDNCDFYFFSDKEINHENSIWRKGILPDAINDLSNAEKNRYIKMHPHLIFPEYKYSIYVDGNVQIITDLTEYVNKMGGIGIATHIHNNRSCVFDELKAIVKSGKETRENVERHRNYLLKSGMPYNYGLLQCSVIVREHNNPMCISVMEAWWEEYLNYSKRDQISLPHVLFREGIKVQEVGVLGNNVYRNPSFRIGIHK